MATVIGVEDKSDCSNTDREPKKQMKRGVAGTSGDPGEQTISQQAQEACHVNRREKTHQSRQGAGGSETGTILCRMWISRWSCHLFEERVLEVSEDQSSLPKIA